MEVEFRNRRLRKILTSDKELARRYGARQGRCISAEIKALQRAATLLCVPTTPPKRRHQLVGNLDGLFAVDLLHPYRMVFAPAHNPVPRRADGGIDLAEIAAIIIMGVEDYH